MKIALNYLAFAGIGALCSAAGLWLDDWRYWAILGCAVVIQMTAPPWPSASKTKGVEP